MKITRGSASVNLYSSPIGKYNSWRVVWRQDKKAKSKRFNSEAKARAFAVQKAEDLSRGLTRTITAEERAAIARAVAHLEPYGKPLELACAEYADILKACGDVPPMEMIRYYKERHSLGSSITVAEVLPEFLKAKERDGLRPTWVRLLRHCLEKFGEVFKTSLADVSAPDINRWLASLNLSTKSRANHRDAVAALVGYCKAHGHLPRKWDVLEDVPSVPVKHGAIQIYTVPEMKAIVANAGRLLPLVAIQAFAGLRHSEVVACEWRNVKDDHIVVPAHTKTGRRIAPVPPNLKAILEPFRKDNGPVFRWASSHAMIARAAESAEVKHKPNAYRHSFISYRVAQTQNIAQTSLEAGNSPAVIRKHYLELVTKQQAEEWFSIGLI